MRVNALSFSLKRSIKQHANKSKIWWYSRFHAFSPAELTDALMSLGIAAGDVVIAHIAYNEFVGFTGRPSDVIASLRAALTPTGTLLMPSIPFTGSALAYVRSGKTFDVRRTPSQMGIISELFRRSPGTHRSLHPTHPILASGLLAEQVIADHHLAPTPCGDPSPFAKLVKANGKIALLGTGIGVMTFYHYLEDRFENLFPASPLTRETFSVEFRGYGGETLCITTRLYDPELSRRRNLSILEKELKSCGTWRERKLGKMAAVVLETGSISATVREMAERGIFCYA
jgi:aminoglycoside 3-N-acetyltransferase